MKALTLREVAEGLNKYLAEHPDQAELPALTSRDDEGNGYNKIYFSPSYGLWEVYSDEVEGVCIS